MCRSWMVVLLVASLGWAQDPEAKPLPPAGDTGLTGALDEAAFKKLHELKDDKAPDLKGSMIDVGGVKMYLSLPAGAKAPLPGVLVIHEWWGLNDHIKHWADRLAADGYAALAVDLYGGQVAKTPDAAMKLMREVDAEAASKTLREAFEFLGKDERVAAKRRASIGWCFGGAWSLNLARSTKELDAAVIYYGRLATDPAVLKSIHAEVLGVFGNLDRSIPPETVSAFEKGLTEAGVTHAIHRYDANHAFANPSSARYDEASAKDAWSHVRKFLSKKLKT